MTFMFFQVFLNGKKVGSELSKHHRKAVVPCKPNRDYTINLMALTNHEVFGNSDLSNTLHVNTSGNQSPQPVIYADNEEEEDDDMGVSDTS